MSFKRNIWLKWQNRKPCPYCDEGTLVPETDTFIEKETIESIELGYEGYYMEMYNFTCHLKCSSCNNHCVVIGSKDVVINGDHENTFNIKGFYPAPKIITIPESSHKSLKDVLQESFILYWVDTASCANKIRVALEVLMDLQKVKSEKTTKAGKIIKMNLNERIKLFEKINFEIADNLSSIKLIGNFGSHSSKVNKKLCLDAYEILEYCLEELYPDRKARISALSSNIKGSKLN